MGQKKPSVRTLKSGQKVMHHPPSPGFDEGHEVLLPGQSPLIAYLDQRERDLRAAQEDLKQERVRRAARKVERQAAGPDPVPAEKSPI